MPKHCIASEIFGVSLSAALARGQIGLTRHDTEVCCVSNSEIVLAWMQTRSIWKDDIIEMQLVWCYIARVGQLIKLSHYLVGESAGTIHSDQLWIGGEEGGEVDQKQTSRILRWFRVLRPLINTKLGWSPPYHSVDRLFMQAWQKATHTQSIIAILCRLMTNSNYHSC